MKTLQHIKKTLLLAFFAAILIPPSLYGQLEILNEGYAQHKIDFINKDTGWMMSYADGLLKTLDGGENWFTIPCPALDWNNCDFINDSVGWVYGHGEIYKTNNGGLNWDQLFDSQTHIYPFIVTEDIVILDLGDSTLKTMDDGTSWENITPPNYRWIRRVEYPEHHICNKDPGTIIFAGNKGYEDDYIGFLTRTFDGGETWDEITVPELGEIYEIGLIDDSVGYFLTSTDSSFVICKTTDNFFNWSIITEC